MSECKHRWRVLSWLVVDSWNDNLGRNVPEAWSATHLYCDKCLIVAEAPKA